MKFFIGTSGFAYKEWKGNFYPEKLPDKEMLAYYSGHFSTVEVNYTFRQLPTKKTIESWLNQTPKSFRFVLKARQVITHFKRLQDVEKETDDFLRAAEPLGKQLGPILFQLPPNFKKDVPRLDKFLKHLKDRAKAAIEFRHASWLDEETFDCLRAHAAALCVADAEDLPTTDMVRTANWGLVRLRRERYTPKQLGQWIDRMNAQKWKEAHVFFKHEDEGTGPKLATRFSELAAPEG